MLKRLTVSFSESERVALDRLAQADVRPVKDQVRALVRAEARRRHILRDLRELWGAHPTDRLTPDELTEVANGIAAGLEERGYPITPAAELETLTLTTAHAASSYGRPVLVIDGEAYGAGDALPDGQAPIATLVDFVRRFLAPVGLGLELTARPRQETRAKRSAVISPGSGRWIG